MPMGGNALGEIVPAFPRTLGVNSREVFGVFIDNVPFSFFLDQIAKRPKCRKDLFAFGKRKDLPLGQIVPSVGGLCGKIML